MKKIDFDSFENALKTFESAIKNPPKSDLERDGIIQRFEYTFELSWKSIRKILLLKGRNEVSSSPKPLFRDAFEENIIYDIKPWFKYIDAKNKTSHIYNKEIADLVFKDIGTFAQDARLLLEKLNEHLKNNN